MSVIGVHYPPSHENESFRPLWGKRALVKSPNKIILGIIHKVEKANGDDLHGITTVVFSKIEIAFKRSENSGKWQQTNSLPNTVSSFPFFADLEKKFLVNPGLEIFTNSKEIENELRRARAMLDTTGDAPPPGLVRLI